MHGHALFKIHLALHQRGLTSYMQQFDVTINKSKNKGARDNDLTTIGRIEQEFHKGVKMGEKIVGVMPTRDSCQVFLET